MSTDPNDFVHSIDAPSPQEVEAAAIAYFVAVQPNHRKPEDWEGVSGVWKKSYRDQSAAALTAAAPHIIAKALRDAADSYYAGDKNLWTLARETPFWLNARAANIEQGATQ